MIILLVVKNAECTKVQIGATGAASLKLYPAV